MVIEELLQGRAVSQFMEEHYLRLPFAMAGGARRFCPLGGRTVLESLCCSPDAGVTFARQGAGVEAGELGKGELLTQRIAEGCTAVVRHAERHHPQLAELARKFEHDFLAPADVHLYATPAQAYGFGWHYDAEDVFLLQTEGSKEYRLRKNTVNPWPVAQALPADMHYERELMPLFACVLEPGDWLYVPHGYWHYGQAVSDSMTLAIGLMMPTGIDVLEVLQPGMHASIRWRQRLPCVGPSTGKSLEQASAEYHERLCTLADELHELMASPAFARSLVQVRLAQYATNVCPSEGEPVIPSRGERDHLPDTVPDRSRPGNWANL